ncbi:hypothetical protein ACOTCN_12135 [Achromobacter xylosoxidans]
MFGIDNKVERSSLLLALKALRWTLTNTSKDDDLVLDFSGLKKTYAEGALLFTAELRRLIHLRRGSFHCKTLLPRSSKVTQVLKQVGILDLLGVTESVVCVDEDVVNWRHAYGSVVEGQKYEDILAAYDGEISKALSQHLYTVITEAMTNVVNHAYDFPRLDGIATQPAGWWMFSQEKNGTLYVAFCDLGAGIPGTLPKKRPHIWRALRELGKGRDGLAIKAAVKESVSRTQRDNRGRGLSQIVSMAESTNASFVTIYSNKGRYNRNADGKVKIHTYRDSILGTLIRWTIPLRKQDMT